jgi:transcriptional regulator with XRE-family HTH domain
MKQIKQKKNGPKRSFRSVNEAIRYARNVAGMTMEAAAWELGNTYSTLSKYERGKTETPPRIIRDMAKIYNTPWLTYVYFELYFLNDPGETAS